LCGKSKPDAGFPTGRASGWLSGENGKEVVIPLRTDRKEAAKTLWNRLMSGTSQELSGGCSFKISVFVKNLAKLRKCSDTGLKAGKLDDP
jgi:hypothetical protein